MAERSRAGGLLLLVLSACAGPQQVEAPAFESLPSWQAGEVRDAILGFLEQTTVDGAPNYLLPEDRIAVFDHDGTLIVEQPRPVQFDFIYQRVQALSIDHPDWSTAEPYSLAVAGDFAQLDQMSFGARGKLMDAAQSGISQDDFEKAAVTFLSSARHPRFDRPYPGMVYQPMLELIELLHAQQFKVFIVSGGGIEFIRRLSETAYGIPRDRVIGSSMRYELRAQEGVSIIFRKPGFASLNVARYKAINIQLHIGRRPVLAVGNSDGDLQMLQFADTGAGSLVLLLQHDDGVREYQYQDDAVQVRQAAAERGWQVVSMQRDFKRIFPAELPQ